MSYQRKPYTHTPEYWKKHEFKKHQKQQEALLIKHPDHINILPNEEYRPTGLINEKNQELWVSNMGHFYIQDMSGNKRIKTVGWSTNKTHRLYGDITFNNRRYRVSRIMARIFLDPEFPLEYTKGNKYIVDHINNDSTDNRVENLEIIFQSENIRRAVYRDHKTVGHPARKCYAYNIHTGERREYESTIELSRDIWHSANAGYFNASIKRQSINAEGWRVGYNEDK